MISICLFWVSVLSIVSRFCNEKERLLLRRKWILPQVLIRWYSRLSAVQQKHSQRVSHVHSKDGCLLTGVSIFSRWVGEWGEIQTVLGGGGCQLLHSQTSKFSVVQAVIKIELLLLFCPTKKKKERKKARKHLLLLSNTHVAEASYPHIWRNQEGGISQTQFNWELSWQNSY